VAKQGREDSFTGRAGHLAVLAELVMRGCNAAIPEVDEGTDVLAFREDPFEVIPIQVKTASAAAYRKTTGHAARFSIPLRHLEERKPPNLVYVLAVWLETRFVDFVIVPRKELRQIRMTNNEFGSEDGTGNLVLTIQFREEVVCGTANLSRFRNAWPLLPVVGSR
jgi:hypothetical protein